MKEFSLMLGVVVLWIAINRWVLPWFGISTCMSGGCAADRCASSGPETQMSRDAEAMETKGNEP